MMPIPIHAKSAGQRPAYPSGKPWIFSRGGAALWLLAAAAALGPAPARAHGDAHRAAPAATPFDAAKVQSTPFGQAGDPARATRTVQVRMDDRMRFVPARIEARQGETLRLVIRNRGRVLHELVLGTDADLRAHAELMKKHPGMEHDEPHMAHVPPSARGEIVWQFTQPGEFRFACLIPGHFEAGMVGTVVVR